MSEHVLIVDDDLVLPDVDGAAGTMAGGDAYVAEPFSPPHLSGVLRGLQRGPVRDAR